MTSLPASVASLIHGERFYNTFIPVFVLSIKPESWVWRCQVLLPASDGIDTCLELHLHMLSIVVVCQGYASGLFSSQVSEFAGWFIDHGYHDLYSTYSIRHFFKLFICLCIGLGSNIAFLVFFISSNCTFCISIYMLHLLLFIVDLHKSNHK